MLSGLAAAPLIKDNQIHFIWSDGRPFDKGYTDGAAAPLLISLAEAADSFIKDN
jgi:hypothetical protein